MTKASPRVLSGLFSVALLAGSACADFAPKTTGAGGTGPGTGGSTSGGGTGGSTTGGGTGGTTTTGSGGAVVGGGSGGVTGGGSGGRSATGGASTGTGGATTSGTGGAVGTGSGGGPGTITRVVLTGKKVLFIVGSPTSPATGDMSLQGVFTNRGMVVTLVDGATLDPNAATMNLIVGSDTAGSAWPALYKDVAVPMIAFGNAFTFPLGFTATSSAKGSVSTPAMLTIIDAATPLAAAFTAGTNLNVIGTQRNSSFYWSTPGGAPIRVASVMGTPAELSVFAFEKGAMMAIGTAAARRVSLGWRTDFVTTDLSIEAFRMMNVAIEWTATAP